MMLALILFFSSSANAAILPMDFSDAQWKPAFEKKGIAVARADFPDSKISAFQAEAILDAPIEKVVGVIQDSKRRPEWTPNVEEAQVLERLSPTEWIEYWHFGTPIVISDRESIVQIKAEFDEVKKRLIVQFWSVDHPKAPKTKRVRANVLRGTHVLWPTDDGKKTHFLYQAQTDLGGSVSKGLVRGFQKDYPYDLIQSLRKQTARQDVSAHPSIRKLFNGEAAKLEDIL